MKVAKGDPAQQAPEFFRDYDVCVLFGRSFNEQVRPQGAESSPGACTSRAGCIVAASHNSCEPPCGPACSRAPPLEEYPVGPLRTPPPSLHRDSAAGYSQQRVPRCRDALLRGKLQEHLRALLHGPPRALLHRALYSIGRGRSKRSRPAPVLD